MVKNAKFSKLYYVTLSGEKKLNGASLYVSKDVLDGAGINVDAPLELQVEKGQIIIKEKE